MSNYTSKIKTPVYEIKGDKPKLIELVNTNKFDEIMLRINDADIPSGIKTFLAIAATRHYKFDYAKIAEYYANSSKEIQELFEDSALVIVDFDDAIAKGFVRMNKKLMEIRSGSPE